MCHCSPRCDLRDKSASLVKFFATRVLSFLHNHTYFRNTKRSHLPFFSTDYYVIDVTSTFFLKYYIYRVLKKITFKIKIYSSMMLEAHAIYGDQYTG